MFDSNGRTSFITTAASLAKLASNNRIIETADENKAVCRSIAYFGTYSVGKPDKSYTTKVEGSTFPNWAGETQKRIAAISGDELTITNSSGSAGGIAGSKWKRVK
jgi:hypothetical protein